MRQQVLVVHNDRPILRRLATLLELGSFNVRAVASRQEAEMALTQRAFDMLITEMDMRVPVSPFYDGDIEKRELRQPDVTIFVSPFSRADWKIPAVKAVLLNRFEDPGRIIAAIQSGLDGFIQLSVRHNSALSAAARNGLRVIVPHRNDDVIEGFGCSHCQWFYPMKNPKPLEISWQQCSKACEAFDAHVCLLDLKSMAG